MRKPPRRAIFRLSTEAALRREGISRIAGVDEVGRGCWAGPVYAAAVVLSPACYRDRSLLARVVDSKLLSPSLREHLAADILRLALGVSIAWVEAPVIDRLNILGATRRVMYAALECLAGGPLLLDAPGGVEGVAGRQAGWPGGVEGVTGRQAGWPGGGVARLAGGPVTPQFVLSDAVPLPDLSYPHRAITRADRSCLAVAAASIVAKVARDAEMCRRQALFPQFALDRNKGYGTAAHVRALYASGLTPIHRRSFAPMKYLLGLRDHVSGALPPPPRPGRI